jgi:hypothetical protein
MATYDVVKSEMRKAGWEEGPALIFSASVATVGTDEWMDSARHGIGCHITQYTRV